MVTLCCVKCNLSEPRLLERLATAIVHSLLKDLFPIQIWILIETIALFVVLYLFVYGKFTFTNYCGLMTKHTYSFLSRYCLYIFHIAFLLALSDLCWESLLTPNLNFIFKMSILSIRYSRKQMSISSFLLSFWWLCVSVFCILKTVRNVRLHISKAHLKIHFSTLFTSPASQVIFFHLSGAGLALVMLQCVHMSATCTTFFLRCRLEKITFT